MTKIIINENIIKNNKIKLSKSVLTGIQTNKHSLGCSPCFPPSEEKTFDDKIINIRFNQLIDKLKKFKDIENIDVVNLKNILKETILNIISIESDNKKDLINICYKTINNLFQIPDNTILLDIDIVDKINDDQIKINLEPKETSDFEYGSIREMKELEEFINKRRFTNSLTQGAALFFSEAYELYLNDIYKIDPRLPELYTKAMTINNILYFIDKYTIVTDISKKDGIVKLIINDDKPTKIIVKGVNFISILNESIKGLFELFSTYGLPDEKEKSKFVIAKSDFGYAEPWDIRFGYPLWEIIFGNISLDKTHIIPTIYTELISLPNNEFFEKMQEILGKTKIGKDYLNNLQKEIETNNDLNLLNDDLGIENDFLNIDDLESITP